LGDLDVHGRVILKRILKEWGRDSAVGIVTTFRAGRCGVRIPSRTRNFLFSKSCGPPSFLFNGHRGYFSGVKRSGREVDYSPPPTANVKNYWNYTSASPLCLHGVDGEICYFSVYLNDIEWESVNWTRLARDRDKCWPLVNAESTFGFHKMRIFQLTKELLHFQRLCSTVLNWLVGYAKVNVHFELETCSSRYVSTLCTYPCNWRNFNLN